MKKTTLIFFIFCMNFSVLADTISCYQDRGEYTFFSKISFNLAKWNIDLQGKANGGGLKCDDIGENSLGAWVICRDPARKLNLAFFEKDEPGRFESWLWFDREAEFAVRYECELIKVQKKNQQQDI